MWEGMSDSRKARIAWALDDVVLAAAVPMLECVWDNGSHEQLELCKERHFNALRLAKWMGSMLDLPDYDPFARIHLLEVANDMGAIHPDDAVRLGLRESPVFVPTTAVLNTPRDLLSVHTSTCDAQRQS
jgi:hypothetical protein